jgi:hypothetical protein
MVLPKIISLISIVVLSAWMLYFVMGGLPLLILKHDDLDDSRLVRGFFDVHYRVLLVVSAIGVLSSALASRWLLATAIMCVALIGFVARKTILSRMDQIRTEMHPTNNLAVRNFRRLHISGIALDVLLLVGFLSTLSFSSGQIVSCIPSPPGCQGEECRMLCSLLS